MAGQTEPQFQDDFATPSSAHESYHPIAIQLYGHANKFNATTTNRDEYKQWELPERHMHAPAAARPQVPFEGTSSYHDAYHPHQLEARVPVHVEPYKGTGVKFDATSSYHDQYPAHALQQRSPMAPVTPKRDTGKFDGTSSYKDQYPAYQVEPHVPQHGPKYEHKSVPFDATTTNQDMYKAYQVEPHVALHAPVQARPHTKFEGTTTNQDAYKAYAVQPREVHHVDYKYAPVPFEGETEAHAQYKQWELEKRPPPPPAPIRASLPFEGTTTNKEMFKGWALPKKRPTLGIAMVGDQYHVLLPSTLTTPCHGKQVFTTVHDNQPHMSFVIYAGDSPKASNNVHLGQFQLLGVPEAPFGEPQIEITFHLDNNNVLTVEARDQDSGRHHLWKSSGGAVVANGVSAADLNTQGHYVVDYANHTAQQPIAA